MGNNESLKEAILEHLKNSPKRKDSVDLVSYFNIRADVTMQALAELQREKRVVRVETGIKSWYYVA